MIWNLLFSFLLLSSTAFAAVENIDTFNDGTTPVVNENFRTLNDNVNKTNTSVAALTAFFYNGILGSASGGTYANLSACTQGSIPYFYTTGKMNCLAPTVSGDTLQSGGVGINPFFTTPITYNLKLVSNTTLSGASTSGNIAISSTKQYYVKCVLTANQNDQWNLRINADSGNNYKYVGRSFDTSATAYNFNNNVGTAQILLGVMDGSVQPLEIDFYINKQSTASTKALLLHGRNTTISMNSTGTPGYLDWMAQWANTATATSFVLFSLGGGFTMTGNIYLYEILTS